MCGRSGDRHRFDPRVGEGGVEVALDPDAGVAAAEVFGAAFVELAEAHQAELGSLDDVADDVRPPVAVSDDHGADRSMLDSLCSLSAQDDPRGFDED